LFAPSRIEIYGQKLRFDFDQDTHDLQVFQVNRQESMERMVKIITRVTPNNHHLKKLSIGTVTLLGVNIKAKPKTADGRDVTYSIEYQ
jgi:hypothetical protein